MSNELYEKIRKTVKNSLVEVVFNATMYAIEIKDYFALQEKFSGLSAAVPDIRGYFIECKKDLVLLIHTGCGTGVRQAYLHIPLPAIKDYRVKSTS
jgi:hypothetical protein